jgi:hypothetical protein
MKKTHIILIWILATFSISCITFEVKGEEQIYPEADFESVNSIEIHNFAADSTYRLDDKEKIKILTDFFKDSTSYFKKEKVKFNGVKSTYSIKFLNSKDTLNLGIYPTYQPNKLEIGFFEKLKSNSDKNNYIKYSRFYINEELLSILKGKNK